MPLNRPNAETLFHQALELELHQRSAFLDAACGSDLTLQRRVEALLSAHEQATGFLPEDVGGTPKPSLNTSQTENTGTVIGHYKLLEKLGEGGFGVVWAAEQREPIRRRVALKIIKLGMDTKQVIARFEAERHALALMDHPNIAKVLDAGATDAGRPFFVMELVRGIPITTYCEEQRLGTKDRLDLFIKICQAIQHAHQKGIIHRDIKPSNIMVTLHDGVPVPKVIDFGIAKATQAELTEKTIYTQIQQFIGTPAYMSPEQAEMSGLDMDTRSDIYSLGVLLYELLTGNTPFDGKKLLAAGLDEMRRIIREQEPVRPSTKLNQTRAAMTLSAKPKIRGPYGSSLKSEIDKDLDWIVMKCLEKDRARRYETANGLAMDVKRHLNNETVVARPPSAAYRLQKAFRRNKLAFTAATMVAASLILGLGLSTWMFLRERQARAESDQRAATITRNLYFAEMILAGQAAAEPGGIARVAEITEQWRPQKNAEDQRGWEWYYLRSLIHLEGFTINGHTSAVLAVAWSFDGKRMASAGADNTIKIWAAGDGSILLTLRGHTNQVNSVAWSPDGKYLASGSRDQTIKVWNAATGEEAITLLGHTSSVRTVSWSPNGKQLASGTYNRIVRIWDPATGQIIRTFIGHTNMINSVAWSPDGQQLVSASADHTMKIWHIESAQEIRTVYAHDLPFSVNTVSWSPDGKYLASGGNDNKVMICDAKAGTNVFAIDKHSAHVLSVAWSPDGKCLISGSADNTIAVWDVARRTNIVTLRGHTSDVKSVAWSPDGKRVASGGADTMLKVWPIESEPTVILRGHTNFVRSVTWSPDGKHLASGGADNLIKVWDAVSWMNILTFHGHTDDAFSVAWSPDGKHLASGSHDKTIKIWDTDSRTNILTLTGHPGGLTSVAWSTDRKLLASSGWAEKTVRIWDMATREVIRTLSGHTRWVFSASWSPDGKRLASAGHDSTVKIWDPVTAKVIHTLEGHTDVVRSVTWSPDGKRLASASIDSTIKVWDVDRGTNILTLRGHTDPVVLVAWSPDGKRLASASFDHTVKVWDPDTGHETLTLRGHTDEVQSVAWSPDGKRLASASRDYTVRIWDASEAYSIERRQSASR